MSDRNNGMHAGTRMGASAIDRLDASRGDADGGTHDKVSSVSFRPPMDLYDLRDRYEIHLDLPGSSTDQIEVTVHDGLLTVEAGVPSRYRQGITPMLGEYSVGDFRRQIRLGEDIDGDGLAASYVDGVLRLVLPKRAERRPRRIEVRNG